MLLGVTPAAGRAATPPPAVCPSPSWVSAWTLSPSDSDGPGVTDTTLRSLAYLHAGGSGVRVHLSNRLGTAPATVGAASVGVRDAGPGLVAGSLKALTFDGLPGTTLAAGAEAVSDPLPYPVSQFDELEISLWVTDAAHPSRHLLASQPGFTAPGDRTTDEAGTTFTAYPTIGEGSPQDVALVSGVDVLTDTVSGVVVALGDSITDGVQTRGGKPTIDQIGTNSRWPDALARALADAGTTLSVADAGISGNAVLSALGGPRAGDRLDPDVLAQAGVTTVVVELGVNDLLVGHAAATDVEAGLTDLVTRIHAAGVTVLLATLTPFGATGATETQRVALNAWVRDQSLADGVVDLDSTVADPAAQNQVLAAYDGGDGIHLDSDGYQALADAVRPLDLRAGSCGAPAVLPVPETLPTARADHRLRTGLLIGGAAVLVLGGLAVALRANARR